MERRAYAAKAFYENMPLRRASLPDGPNIRIHRRFDYGDLARFHMLDTRQFQSRQACGGGTKPTGDPQDSPYARRWYESLRENPQVKV